MKLEPFIVEQWMTDHEKNCLYNLADTCCPSLSINDLIELSGDNKIGEHILDIKNDYGSIVGSDELKQAILNLYQTGDKDNIAICQGCTNADALAMMTLIKPGDEVITALPTYQQFYSFPESLGAKVNYVYLQEDKGWRGEIADFVGFINDKTKMIILNNPNNPTGTSYSRKFLEELSEYCLDKKIYILIDEIYQGLNDEEVSISDIYRYGIASSGLSKILSFAGLRIGWLKGPKDFIKLINLRRDYHIISTGAISDYLAYKVLINYAKIIEKNKKIIADNKDYLREWLKENQRTFSCIIPDNGGVAFLKYKVPILSEKFCQELLDEFGVFLIPGKCFDQEYHLRLGLGIDSKVFISGLKLLREYILSKK